MAHRMVSMLACSFTSAIQLILPIGTVDFCGAGYLDTSHVVGNDITTNNVGVIFQGPIGQSLLDDFHHNRIAGNSVGVQNNTGLGISGYKQLVGLQWRSWDHWLRHDDW